MSENQNKPEVITNNQTSPQNHERQLNQDPQRKDEDDSRNSSDMENARRKDPVAEQEHPAKVREYEHEHKTPVAAHTSQDEKVRTSEKNESDSNSGNAPHYNKDNKHSEIKTNNQIAE